MLFPEISKPFKRYYVKLGKCVGHDDKVWTFEMNTDNDKVPIVLLHGFGINASYLLSQIIYIPIMLLFFLSKALEWLFGL
jgi:hypothetical protein